MLDTTTRQQTLIDSESLSYSWRFRIENADGSRVLFLSTREITADTDGQGFLIDQHAARFLPDRRFFAGAAFGLSTLRTARWLPGARFFDEEQSRDYDFGIVEFSSVNVSRTNTESGIFAPGEMTLCIANKDSYLDPDSFEDGTIHVAQSLDDGTDENVVRRWLFRIKTAEPGYQKIYFTCEDFLQKYLRGSYPNTRLIKDLFPSSDINQDDAVCVPEPYGTAYVPLRSVYKSGLLTETATDISATASANGSRCKFTRAAGWDESYEVGRAITVSGFTSAGNNGTFTVLSIDADEIEVPIDAGLATEAAGDSVTISQGSRPYLLGPSDLTYTITEVRSPREWGKRSTWGSGSYTFTQHTFADVDGTSWKGVLPIIADVDSDGTADAPGYWQSGDIFLDMPVKFTRSDTVSMTNPADVIRRVLINMGVPAERIDIASFATAKAIFTSWDLFWHGAFWYKQDRAEVLKTLLSMCHAYIIVTDYIELHTYSAASRKTILKKDVVRDSFSYRDVIELPVSDSGYVAYMTSGESQDKFYKVLVPAKGDTRTQYSDDVLTLPFVQDSQDAQKLGTLYFQKKLMVNGEIDFTGQPACLALNPGDVINMDDWDYGGRYAALIDSVTYNKDLTVSITASRYSAALDDFGDLSPSVITIPSDDTAYLWAPALGGPLSSENLATAGLDVWGRPYLVIAPDTNRGDYTDLQSALNALLQSRYEGILARIGTYTLPATYFTDRNFFLQGESQDGVIFRNTAGSNLFVLHNLTKTIELSNFTIQSLNSGSYTRMIYCYGDTEADNTSKLLCDRITFDLVDSGSAGSSSGDKGVYCYKGNGQATVQNCRSDDGSIPFDFYYYDRVLVRALRQVLNPKHTAIRLTQISDFDCSENIIEDFVYRGITVDGDGLRGSVSQNKIKSATSGMSANVRPLYIEGAAAGPRSCAVFFNDIKVVTTGDVYVHGISFNKGSKGKVIANDIYIDISSIYDTMGIAVDGVLDTNLSSNTITVDNSNKTGTHYGIQCSDFDDSPIGHNHVDMVNSDAKDVGYRFESSCSGLRGSGNISLNAGTDESDAGSNNVEINGA